VSLIFVDCEANGPCPGCGWLTEFGAVEWKTRSTFHGVLVAHNYFLEIGGRGMTEEWFGPRKEYPQDAIRVFAVFKDWLGTFEGSPIFVSDNPAFDWQWINWNFHHLLGTNPFGHSARRIGDFYAGLEKDFRRATQWKRWRKTKHDHHPVHDALGNVEAFDKMLKKYEIVRS